MPDLKDGDAPDPEESEPAAHEPARSTEPISVAETARTDLLKSSGVAAAIALLGNGGSLRKQTSVIGAASQAIQALALKNARDGSRSTNAGAASAALRNLMEARGALGVLPKTVPFDNQAMMAAAGRGAASGSALGAAVQALTFLSQITQPDRFKPFIPSEDEPSSYSPEMTSPAKYFEYTEGHIDSVDDLHRAITQLSAKNAGLRFVWRGHRDASWGLHSLLFRKLSQVNGVEPPSEELPTGQQPYPTEQQMIETEAAMLGIARDEWRLGNLDPLELLARLQHHGAPTRLIDITKNPYIAAWFAVEQDAVGGEDSRLFALATSAPGTQTDGIVERSVREDDLILDGQLLWHGLSTPEDRSAFQWGTGAFRRVWVPPTYDQRIAAQNAGFILDGVPVTSQSVAPYFRKAASSTYWKRADLLASGSIYIKMARPNLTARQTKVNLAPTFSWRISSHARLPIRKFLEKTLGYTRATIYPDVSGLSSHLSDAFADIAADMKDHYPTSFGNAT